MYDETTIQPQYDPQASGAPMADVSPSENGPRHRALMIASACIVALFGLIAGAVWTMHAHSNAVAFAQTGSASAVGQTAGSVADPSTVAGDSVPSADAVPSAVAADGAPAGNAGGAAKAPAAPTAPAAPAGPAPTITSFHTPDTIDCHNGNFQTFSAGWTTTNATRTTISIDGPGIYKTYGPNANESLPFNCSSAHSFTLTAFGANGKTVTKAITLQPRNVQPAKTADPGNEAPTGPASGHGANPPTSNKN
jgi:hypothetical protein